MGQTNAHPQANEETESNALSVSRRAREQKIDAEALYKRRKEEDLLCKQLKKRRDAIGHDDAFGIDRGSDGAYRVTARFRRLPIGMTRIFVAELYGRSQLELTKPQARFLSEVVVRTFTDAAFVFALRTHQIAMANALLDECAEVNTVSPLFRFDTLVNRRPTMLMMFVDAALYIRMIELIPYPFDFGRRLLVFGSRPKNYQSVVEFLIDRRKPTQDPTALRSTVGVFETLLKLHGYLNHTGLPMLVRDIHGRRPSEAIAAIARAKPPGVDRDDDMKIAHICETNERNVIIFRRYMTNVIYTCTGQSVQKGVARMIADYYETYADRLIGQRHWVCEEVFSYMYYGGEGGEQRRTTEETCGMETVEPLRKAFVLCARVIAEYCCPPCYCASCGPAVPAAAAVAAAAADSPAASAAIATETHGTSSASSHRW